MKLRTIFAILLIPCLVIAGGSFNVEVVNKVLTTNSVTKTNIEGYLDTIFIDVTGTTSSRVWIVSSDEVIFTNAVVKVDTVLRPTMLRDGVTGAVLTGDNAVASRVYLDNESLTFYVAELSDAFTNTYLFKVKMVKQLP